jgi:hypothetical protein
MKLLSLATVALFLGNAPLAAGVFVIDLAADTGTSSTNEHLSYYFHPLINVYEDGVLTDAVVTLSSPTRAFVGYENPRSSGDASSINRLSQSDLVDEVNGFWRLTVEEGSVVHVYQVEVELTLPFETLPRLVDLALSEAGSMSWRYEGGTPSYPGPSATIQASLMTSSFTLIDREHLPIDATSWTPQANLSGNDEFQAFLSILQGAQDFNSLRVISIQPLTDNAPELSFGSVSVTYDAGAIARLVAVPEPAAGVVVLAGFACLVGRRSSW